MKQQHPAPPARRRIACALGGVVGLVLLLTVTKANGAAPTHWSLQPLAMPEAPQEIAKDPWVRTPIDAFVLARLRREGMRPSGRADRTTLLRRVTFDLTGLPPTPAEQRAFLEDKVDGAYERVVDRLLASPRYGERWARHWMDVVHFAETHGNDQDRIRTNAWPYRDYLIRSFNEDKPYARFVREQLAGDVLFPNEPQATVALGFVAAGPWDESSLRDIREDTLDRQIGRYLDRDDMVATTMSTFVSATVHCARCHDHKFDPISQQDYYNLQSVFAGVDRAERVFDEDPAIHAQRQGLLQQRRALERKEPKARATLLEPALQSEIAEWERRLDHQAADWTTVSPTSATSSNGTMLAVQADHSVLATGKRPEKDSYILTLRSPLNGVTGLRLEVLTDDSLPLKGPGRQDNGNLHLSEIHISTREGVDSTDRSIRITRASADFDQEGWTVAHAIDERPETAWGVYPRVGKDHQAVFVFAPGTPVSTNTVLTVRLDQLHGGGHLIGRARLALTTASSPALKPRVPEAIERILGIASTARTTKDREELAGYFVRERIERELSALPRPRFVYAGASDFVRDGGLVPAATPRVVQVLKRGDINRPSDEAAPGALSAITSLPSRFALENPGEEGSRRAALAEWIVDARNPLTWRSIVNRVWHYHFGRGLVDTPNDLGVMGSPPSHPELLDWLAVQFRDTGGSLKALHRLLVTSAVYRQATQDVPAFAARDGDNRLLWRMNRTRLDAESLRDAILQISGDLDLTMGGPSVKQFSLAPGIHVTPVVDYTQFDLDGATSHRRSIYRFLFRTLPDPFMDTLDCPEASQLAPVRTSSVTALQALATMNNPFMVHQSQRLARLLEQSRRSPRDQVSLAFDWVLGRKPTRRESREFTAHATAHGLANTCRLLFNSNEFVFVN